MNFKILVLLTTLFISGCVTSGGPGMGEVNKDNGVDSYEAIIIAKENLKQSTRHSRSYKLKTARIVNDMLAKEHPRYWFVFFDAKKFDNEWYKYAVVIHKGSGRIQYADAFVPLDVINYSFMFNGSY